MADAAHSGDERISEAALNAVMRETPKGAFALCTIAVLLLLLGWFYVYFVIFVPRGTVG